MLDVIVIGAGAAGLSAARTLKDGKLSFTILEAQNRIGGRVYTLTPNPGDEPVELGAEFLHGLPSEVQEFVELEELQMRDGQGLLFTSEGKLIEDFDFFGRVSPLVKRLQEFKQKDLSFSEFVKTRCADIDPFTQNLCTQYIESYHASDVTRISVQALARIEKESEENKAVEEARHVRGGLQILIHRLADSIQDRIQLNQVVKKIDYKTEKVLVHLEAGKIIEARAALVTVPLGVLQAPVGQEGAIEFDPPLPDSKKQALSQLFSGPAVRIVYQFSKPFWEELQLSKWAVLWDCAPEAKIFAWWNRGNLLTGWYGGVQSQEFKDYSQKDFRTFGVKTLARIFKLPESEIDRLLLNIFYHNWMADPFARGAYSSILVGGIEAYQNLANPIENRLFFAGEAMEFGGYSGTVNGAVLSGIRAGKAVLNHLKK